MIHPVSRSAMVGKGCPCLGHPVISIALQALLQEYTHVGRSPAKVGAS